MKKKLRSVNPPLFFLRSSWDVLGLLSSHMNFKISLSISAKMENGFLIGIMLNLSVESIAIFICLPLINMVYLSIYLGSFSFLSTIFCTFQSISE